MSTIFFGFYFFLNFVGHICTQCSTVMRMREVTEGGRPPSPYLEERVYEFSLATRGQKLAVGENVCTYVYVFICICIRTNMSRNTCTGVTNLRVYPAGRSWPFVRMCMCVNVCIYMYFCTYMYVCMYLYTGVRICTASSWQNRSIVENIHTYVYVYVRLFIHTYYIYIFVCTWVFIFIYAYLYGCTNVSLPRTSTSWLLERMCLFIYTWVQVNMCIYWLFLCNHVYVYIYIYILIHVYVYMCIYTDICKYIYNHISFYEQ